MFPDISLKPALSIHEKRELGQKLGFDKNKLLIEPQERLLYRDIILQNKRGRGMRSILTDYKFEEKEKELREQLQLDEDNPLMKLGGRLFEENRRFARFKR